MNSFNMIVMTVAVVFLILILSAVGIIMLFTKNNNQIYPPTSSKCPDYWKLGADGVTCTSSGINEGTLSTTVGGMLKTARGPPKKFESTDTSFLKLGTTQTCGQKHWANLNKVEWDGVSNYNKC